MKQGHGVTIPEETLGILARHYSATCLLVMFMPGYKSQKTNIFSLPLIPHKNLKSRIYSLFHSNQRPQRLCSGYPEFEFPEGPLSKNHIAQLRRHCHGRLL